MSGVATLSNEKNYTVFQFGNHVIRFIAPYSLERYTAVKESVSYTHLTLPTILLV